MPQYIYECEKCGDSHREIHGMTKNPKIKCPKCQSKCFRAIQPVQGYVRGSCYLNKTDCKKQAMLSKLKDDDPYTKHRIPGETDDLINKIKKGKKSKPVSVNGLKQ